MRQLSRKILTKLKTNCPNSSSFAKGIHIISDENRKVSNMVLQTRNELNGTSLRLKVLEDLMSSQKNNSKPNQGPKTQTDMLLSQDIFAEVNPRTLFKQTENTDQLRGGGGRCSSGLRCSYLFQEVQGSNPSVAKTVSFC